MIKQARWMATAALVWGVLCPLCMIAKAGESVPVDPSEYTLVERDKEPSKDAGGVDDFKRGETWITELVLKDPSVHIPLMREDNSTYGVFHAEIGTICDHKVTVTWVLPKILMLISWESVEESQRWGYEGYVLVLLKSSNACVVQRLYGGWSDMGSDQQARTKIDYKFLSIDPNGNLELERVASSYRYGVKRDKNGEHDGSEGVDTRTTYILKDDCLHEKKHSNTVWIYWDEVPTCLDENVDLAWSHMKHIKNGSGSPPLSPEENKRLLKKAIMEKNPTIKDEKGYLGSLLLPCDDPLVTLSETKDMRYPYNEVAQTGWVK